MMVLFKRRNSNMQFLETTISKIFLQIEYLIYWMLNTKGLLNLESFCVL
ncbi:hypothetical protein Goshw_029932 [Gossypium schwendimanii]|uniref:Uncharacterized protein n=1 Tax=Gossypium schwendimanii TaxID=34291 RepID=A0A7J9MW39_GOSSC|nr:hypothetical protein [Gossypium schwendimanii]